MSGPLRNLRSFDDGRCRHGSMRGLDKVCALGIDVRAHVGGPDLGWFCRTPCVVSGFSRDVVPCDRFEEFTEAEKQAREDEIKRAVDSVLAGKSPCCGADLIAQGTGRYCEACHMFVARFCGGTDHG